MSTAAAFADDRTAAPERRVALVIGNASYRFVPVLRSPQRDAAAVAGALRQVGFDAVELAGDLDRDGMVKVLETFRAQVDGADWALVYFAGHGIEINDVNYLVPIDAKLADDRSVNDETVSFEAVLTAVGGARALRIIVFDASRTNPFKERMSGPTVSRRPGGLAPPPEPKAGTLVVYSTRAGKVTVDDAEGSPFARAFTAEITRPGVELRHVLTHIRDDVLKATRFEQQPFAFGLLPGRKDFFFVPAR
jgi:uncharacterized caspase-like protein